MERPITHLLLDIETLVESHKPMAAAKRLPNGLLVWCPRSGGNERGGAGQVHLRPSAGLITTPSEIAAPSEV